MSRRSENQEALKMVFDLMNNEEYKAMPENEKTEQILRLLLVDMSVNLAIIADKLEGKE